MCSQTTQAEKEWLTIQSSPLEKEGHTFHSEMMLIWCFTSHLRLFKSYWEVNERLCAIKHHTAVSWFRSNGFTSRTYSISFFLKTVKFSPDWLYKMVVSNVASWFFYLFVCVEVLQPSEPIGVILSSIILPGYTFSWAGLVLAVKQYLCTFFHQKLTTALLESVEERECP